MTKTKVIAIHYGFYAFIFLRHFYFPENVYARNFFLLLTIYYWVFAVLIFLCLFLPFQIKTEKDAQLCSYKFFQRLVSYSAIIGFGIIGEWHIFMPCFIQLISYELFIMKIKPLMEEYRKKNNIPEPVKVEKSKSKNRYELLKRKK